MTGGVVGGAALFEWVGRPGTAATPEQPPRRAGLRWAAGVVVWVIGWGATVAAPVVDDAMVPPRDALLPLPPTMAVTREEVICEQAPAGGRYCVRRFIVAASDNAEIRELVRRLGQHLERSTVEVQLVYSNPHDPVYD